MSIGILVPEVLLIYPKEVIVAIQYDFSRLTEVLTESAPYHTARVCATWRLVDKGLLSVGLKIHYLDGGEKILPLIEKIGGRNHVLELNFYRRLKRDAICWVLYPVGNASCAIELLEAIEIATGVPIFGNRSVQIQVCSPGRLSHDDVALLVTAFCLMSDQLRRFHQPDLETTFSKDQNNTRGNTIALYEAAHGLFMRNFTWWGRDGNALVLQQQLPFTHERTDILTASSRRDIENINLFATLLVHAAHNGYWGELGMQFRHDMLELLEMYQLSYVLAAQWVYGDKNTTRDDGSFIEAVNDLMACALDDAYSLGEKKFDANTGVGDKLSILFEAERICRYYRTEIQHWYDQLNRRLRDGSTRFNPY